MKNGAWWRACAPMLVGSSLAWEAAAQTPPRAPVDLVRALGLTVRVSSTVGNGRDLPTDLIDGDLATAWSAREGELTGAWIEVGVPSNATVSAIALTAGFTRTAPRDLFRMSPRVTRVEVSRDGVRVREATLDPERTDLQAIPVEGTGGVWRVRFTALTPGTQRAWRAARVSELRVMGVAEPLRRAPQVWVAPSPLGRGRAAVAIEGPYGSDEGFCEAMRDEDPERCRPPSAYDEDERVCRCVEPEPEANSPAGTLSLAAPVGPVRAARVVRVLRDVYERDACVLLVTTARGTYAVPGFAACGPSAVPRDTSFGTHFDRFSAAATPGGGARLMLRGWELESLPDWSSNGGPRGSSTTRRFTVSVSVNAAGHVASAVRTGAVGAATWRTARLTPVVAP
jgi:hypothetical protein